MLSGAHRESAAAAGGAPRYLLLRRRRVVHVAYEQSGGLQRYRRQVFTCVYFLYAIGKISRAARPGADRSRNHRPSTRPARRVWATRATRAETPDRSTGEGLDRTGLSTDACDPRDALGHARPGPHTHATTPNEERAAVRSAPAHVTQQTAQTTRRAVAALMDSRDTGSHRFPHAHCSRRSLDRTGCAQLYPLYRTR